MRRWEALDAAPSLGMELGTHSTIAGKYVLEEKLGQGGMGSVWRARHRILDAPVAVKLLRSDRAELAGMRSRFESEAMAMAKLRSRHVITIHDYGIEGSDHAYIVMEMLEGEDLGARLKRDTKLPREMARRFFEQICRGLQAAHDAGIVHRDLKPANIFLTVEDDEEIAKILDFGIAKSDGSGNLQTKHRQRAKTSTGVLLGSPFYMSPEHIQGEWERVDHRADLWSLAVIGYRMLTGLQPFTGDVLPSLMHSIFGGKVQRPVTEVCEGFDERIDAFFRRAFVRDPEGRFASAREMVAAWNDCFDVATAQIAAVRPTGQSSTGHVDETTALDPERLAAMAREEIASLPPDPPADGPTLVAPGSAAPLASPSGAARGGFGHDTTEVQPAPRTHTTAAVVVAAMLVVTAGVSWAVGYLRGDAPAAARVAPAPSAGEGARGGEEAPTPSADTSADVPIADPAPSSSAEASAAPATPSDPPPAAVPRPAKPTTTVARPRPADPTIPDFGY